MSQKLDEEIIASKARRLLALIKQYRMEGQSSVRMPEEDIKELKELSTPEVAMYIARAFIHLTVITKKHVADTNKQLKQLIGE